MSMPSKGRRIKMMEFRGLGKLKMVMNAWMRSEHYLGSKWWTTRWWSRRMYAHLLLQELKNYNSLLNDRWKENVGSHQKKIPHIQGQRRSSSKTVWGVKSCLERKPIHTRHAWRAQTKLVCTWTQRPHRGWARTTFECFLNGGMGQQ